MARRDNARRKQFQRPRRLSRDRPTMGEVARGCRRRDFLRKEKDKSGEGNDAGSRLKFEGFAEEVGVRRMGENETEGGGNRL